MYNKDILDRFLKSEIAINVRTKQEWNDFMELLEKETDVCWENEKPTEFNKWNEHKEASCIVYSQNFKQLIYGMFIGSLYDSYEFVEYQDLIKSDRIVNPTYDDLLPLFTKTNSDRHRDLVNQIHEVYVDKNAKYGDELADTIQKYGMISALTRMNDKFNRIEQFIIHGFDDSEESLKDSLLDLANYCLMTVMEIDR